jgi:hypothetical protein
MLAVTICLGGVWGFKEVAAKDPAPDAKAMEGLWWGFWGGWINGEAVALPMKVELFIQGDHVELHDFPGVKKLVGSFRLDGNARKMHIAPQPETGDKTTKTVVLTYRIGEDALTLTGGSGSSVAFRKHAVTKAPLANAKVEFVLATGINGNGDLLVTEYTVLRVGRVGATFFQPEERSLKTKQATVLLVQETGWKKVTVDEARRLIREAMPVVVAYRYDERPAVSQPDTLRQGMGPARPDSEAAARTFARALRPGTLVFVLSERENSVP